MTDLICGWTKEEVQAEFDRLYGELAGDDRELLLEIFAEAQARGNSWPLRPKFVPRPPLHNGEWLQ